MIRFKGRRASFASLASFVGVAGWALATCATAAESDAAVASELTELRRLTQAQAARLTADEALIRDQAAVLRDQKAQLSEQGATLRQVLSTQELSTVRAAGADPVSAPTTVASGPQSQVPNAPQVVQPVGPVGEAPPPEPLRQVALPGFINVLTPTGHLSLEAAVSYEQTSTQRLVYRGVEIVPGVQVGLVEANNADRNTGIGTVIARYGVLPRFEVEVLAPYVDRSDHVEFLSQRDQTITQGEYLHGSGLGDVEVTGRYQLTGGVNGWPILIANLRFKSDTGKGPFDVDYDQDGVARDLAVGSGFLGLEPSLSMVYTSDPVVVFANVSYLNNFSRDINRVVGGALVGEVNPGNSIGASAGFAFSVNPNFSFTLGYKHNYIEPTTTELGGTFQRSTSLQIGALLFGWSYRFNNRFSLASNLEVGVTGDAPNIVLTFRTPYTF